MTLGSPDNSLKVCGEENVSFGHPGISEKWLSGHNEFQKIQLENIAL